VTIKEAEEKKEKEDKKEIGEFQPLLLFLLKKNIWERI